MDTTVTPAPGSFTAIVDGNPVAVSGAAWSANDDLELTHALPPAAVDAIFNYNLPSDANFRDTEGNLVIAPQSVRGVV